MMGSIFLMKHLQALIGEDSANSSVEGDQQSVMPRKILMDHGFMPANPYGPSTQLTPLPGTDLQQAGGRLPQASLAQKGFGQGQTSIRRKEG
jgi:hypothetical protein